jgi:AcrR family transcriptional regulator
MRRETNNTKGRLLDVAGRLFAAKGYRGTTVAEVCRLAKANIAAVNYHFGSKEDLYREAWRHAHRTALAQFPPEGGVPAAAPAAERLRGRLNALLQRVLHDDGLEFRILDQEAANPTGHLGQVVHETIQPLAQAMEQIVRELLGGRASENSVKLCATSVIGPCLLLMRRRRVRQMPGAVAAAGGLNDLVEHFAQFALGGIERIARAIEAP